MVYQQLFPKTIITQLHGLQKHLYTGTWEIEIPDKPGWIFYLRLGRLIWCEGGANNEERWQRYLKHYCPRLKTTNIDGEKYDLLAKLYQGQMLSKEQLIDFISHFAQEVLLDLVQTAETEEVYEKRTPNQIPDLLLSLISIEPLLNKVNQIWQEWQQAGLTQYALNSYLIIQDDQALSTENGLSLNQALVTAIDGTLSLQGVANKTKYDVIQLMQEIIPFVKLGAITLSAEPQLKLANNEQDEFPPQDNQAIAKTVKKVIACIDDSIGVCEQLKKSLTAAGYGVMVFQDPVLAMSQLLKNAPDLILLDVMMPVVSGYELCKQMRRAPKLKNVPIIILTGKDGWIDRTKAKICGATDFLGKPVRKEKLFETINQYLHFSQ